MKDVPYIIEFAHKYNVPIVFALDFLPDITQYPQHMDAMKECMQRIRES
jgi:sugar/nucleoside kinase (ribokinase family)